MLLDFLSAFIYTPYPCRCPGVLATPLGRFIAICPYLQDLKKLINLMHGNMLGQCDVGDEPYAPLWLQGEVFATRGNTPKHLPALKH